MQDKLYIIIPAYNEEKNIKSVIEEWYPVVETIGNGSKIVIIDDGSKDNTYKVMTEMAESRPMLEAKSKPNSGHGATILWGYHYALGQGADYVFQTDSDGQTKASEFAAFWKLRDQYAMVIGHRRHREDGKSRVFVTKVLKLVIYLCFGVRVVDANTPFRLMQAEALRENIVLVPEDFFLTNVLISVIYTKKKLSVKYLPITFRPRQGGTNSINMKRIWRIGKQAVRDFMSLRKEL